MRLGCALLIFFSITASAENWPLHGRTHDEQRFSPLTQINRDNVAKLGIAWKFATGNTRGMEATPIVVDGTMYVSTAWSRVYALNARTGEQLWHFDPQVPGAKGRDACCDVVNRGVAVDGELVFLGALDGRLIALDRATGAQRWSVQTTDVTKPYTITGAPRVVNGKVIIGNGGAEFGVRGYFSAYDAQSGELIWRFYTVPSENPEQDATQPSLRTARATWPDNSLWESGLGGTVWDSFAYDPALNLLYVGVGNASVYNRAVRSPGGGDNLYVASILAVNPDTGELVWHYQTTPADSWDYTATQHMVLTELNILGRHRKVLIQAPKNGFFYVLDRATGELLSAQKYVPVNWASHVDLETGRPVETDVANWSSQSRMITPAIVGGHNWHPMSFSPRTGLTYIPTIHTTYPFTADPNFRFDARTMNTSEDFVQMTANMPAIVPQFCSPTRLTAWDPVAQQQRWQVKFNSGVSAGLLSTAGGLVFQGSTDGHMLAFADDTGDELWSHPVHVGIMAPPVSYAIDGEQYIAVVAGIGGSQGGHNTVMANRNDGHVFAFKLGGNTAPPDVAARNTQVHVTDEMLQPEIIDKGQALYAVHCLRCHGINGKSSGLYPDLRYSNAEVHAIWKQIVLDGVFAARGMASFADALNAEDVDAIHSFVISEALESTTLASKLAGAISNNVCVPHEWFAE